MFQIVKKMFTVLLSSLINASKHAKCVLLSYKKCKIHATLINLHLYILMNTVKNFTTIYLRLN